MLNVYVCVYGSRYVQLDLYPLYSVSYISADHVLVPRAGTSFVQCFAWSAKRRQMCLVCPTPCAVRLGITGAEHTRPCWYLCWYLFRTVLRLVSPGNVSLARPRTRTGQPNAGKCA